MPATWKGRRRSGIDITTSAATRSGNMRASRSASRPPIEKPQIATGPPPTRACRLSSAASADASQSDQPLAASSPSVPPWPASIGASTLQPRRPSASASGLISNGVPVMPCRQSTPRLSPAMDSGDLSPPPARNLLGRRSIAPPILRGIVRAGHSAPQARATRDSG